MSKASDLRYGRQGGRLVDPRSIDADLAAIARERTKARRAHQAGDGPPWPGDLPASAAIGHPDTIARNATTRRLIAERYPDGIPGTAAARRKAIEELERHPLDPDALADAWLQRARMADARRAAAADLDPVDAEALERHPSPPSLLELADQHRKARR